MSADPNKKSGRSFQCRDVLWETFEQMARELECSVDYLVNEAMKQYARQRSYGGASRTPCSVAKAGHRDAAAGAYVSGRASSASPATPWVRDAANAARLLHGGPAVADGSRRHRCAAPSSRPRRRRCDRCSLSPLPRFRHVMRRRPHPPRATSRRLRHVSPAAHAPADGADDGPAFAGPRRERLPAPAQRGDARWNAERRVPGREAPRDEAIASSSVAENSRAI